MSDFDSIEPDMRPRAPFTPKTDKKPLPWTLRENWGASESDECFHFCYYSINDANGTPIGSDFSSKNITTARLFAAAPDLLEALEDFMRINSQSGYEFDSNESNWFGKAKAAIEKAKNGPVSNS